MRFAGIDVGTSGARVAIVDGEDGTIREASRPFDAVVPGMPPGFSEQDASLWWPAVVECFRELAPLGEIEAVSATSTSGTFLFVEEHLAPITNAIMYGDSRAAEQARRLEPFSARHRDRLGYGFPATFALPKLLWMLDHHPEICARVCFVHAGDYLLSRLLGERAPSDTSTALKTGYDTLDSRWPAWLPEAGVNPAMLPSVGKSGDFVGAVCEGAAQETGLSPSTRVCLGATDGVATMIAAGAAKIGDWASILGTTLVIRGISTQPVNDPQGRVYAHRHPAGLWLPGGASNVGGECLARWFPDADLMSMDRQAAAIFPCPIIAYPLARAGERLPFADVAAQGFFAPEPGSDRERYAACLQGVAMVERWCFELMGSLGAPVGPTVFAGGSAAKSDVWTQLRADVTGRTYRVASHASGAVGAAILAASHFLGGLEAATERVVPFEKQFEPRTNYDGLYAQFREQCAARGYL